MFLTSCGTAVKQLEIFKKEVFEKLEAEGIDKVLFGLTDEQYENLAKNNAQLRAYIVELREILKQYREYYESNQN